MKYKLETIPVWDAFKENSECPLCTLEEKNETNVKLREMDQILLDSKLVSTEASSDAKDIKTRFKEIRDKQEDLIQKNEVLRDEKRDLEAGFLFTVAKITINEGNVSEGLSLITEATDIFQELKDEENLSEIVRFCLAKASTFTIGSAEYKSLSSQARTIQQGDITISEDKTKDAFSNIFDGMMDDMTSLFDPKEKKKRQKMVKKKK